MRAYFFGNLYLSSIQQGIQALHATADMFIRYPTPSLKQSLLHEWAERHKTVILLNAGYSETIRDLAMFMASDENRYPWAAFHEGKDALDGALTCVGIILPEHIYTLSSWFAAGDKNDWRVSQVVNYKSIFMTASSGLPSVVSSGEAGVEWEFSEWDIELASRMSKFGLAR